MDGKQRIGRFDQVKILTSCNVTYLSSAKKDIKNFSTEGVWSVSAILNNAELLCVKSGVLIRIPATDVVKVAEFNIKSITSNFGKFFNAEQTNRQH